MRGEEVRYRIHLLSKHFILLLTMLPRNVQIAILLFAGASAGKHVRSPADPSVSPAPAAGIALFDFETYQLTDAVLQNLVNSHPGTDVLSLFGFDNETFEIHNETCKSFPGDASYPDEATWSMLNNVLGDALIPTIPIAAPCYASSGIYSAEKCADISARFITSELQFVFPPVDSIFGTVHLTQRSTAQATHRQSCGPSFKVAHACPLSPPTPLAHLAAIRITPSTSVASRKSSSASTLHEITTCD
jgi:hypothetical protein